MVGTGRASAAAESVSAGVAWPPMPAAAAAVPTAPVTPMTAIGAASMVTVAGPVAVA